MLIFNNTLNFFVLGESKMEAHISIYELLNHRVSEAKRSSIPMACMDVRPL